MRKLLPCSGALLLVLSVAQAAAAQEVPTDETVAEPGPQETSDAPPDASSEGSEVRVLVRVAPVLVQRDANEDPRAGLFAREFDSDLWRSRLADPDLVVRERSYEDLLTRAQLDPIARVFVEKLADDPSETELAWTARLALRELGAAPSFPIVGSDALGLTQNQFVELYRDMLNSAPELLFMTKRLPRVRVVPIDRGADGGGEQRVAAVRSVQLQQGKDGAKIIVTDAIAGKETMRTYEGETLEAILQENEKLRRDLSLSSKGLPDAFDMRMSVPPSRGGQRALLDPFEYGERRYEEYDRTGWISGSDESISRYFSPADRRVAVRTDVFGVITSRIDKTEAEKHNISSGLVVLRVESGTIADLMDIRTGDILVRLRERALVRPQDITEAMTTRGRPDPVTAVWLNDLEQLMTSTWTPTGAPGTEPPPKAADDER